MRPKRSHRPIRHGQHHIPSRPRCIPTRKHMGRRVNAFKSRSLYLRAAAGNGGQVAFMWLL
jgi:hypothetical protein